MKKIEVRSALHWIDEHGLFAISLFLLVFIPLYPKVPLLEAIPGYLVRVRLEDIVVFLASGFWFIQVLRGKATWWTSVAGYMGCYAFIGLMSLLFAIFISQTIPAQPLHIGKSALHFFRYIEYFSLFVLLFSGIKSTKQVRIAVGVLAVTVALVGIYGFGQKYFEWPVYSTMNREYSKGVALKLTDLARVHSTFGGHYDLAAYLVIVLPILFTWAWWAKNKLTKISLFALQLVGAWLMIVSGSKIAFAAYLCGLGITLLLVLKQRFSLKKTLLFSTGTMVVSLAALLGILAVFSPSSLQKIKNLTDQSGQQAIPTDVVGRPLDETWSENARKYGLSMGIRLDTLWPQAIKGWIVNPWLGKGYATLNKQGDQEFTEADSTDNNYLRVLGETGLLGFGIFSILIITIIRSLSFSEKQSSRTSLPLAIGFVGSTIGLLINATIIDVFSASKVAFTYWAVAGLVLKTQFLARPEQTTVVDARRINRFTVFFKTHWAYVLAISLFIVLIHKQPFSSQSLVQNIELAPDSLQSASFAYCLTAKHTWDACRSLSGITTIGQYAYSLYLVPWYAAIHHPSMFYFANLILALLGISILYLGLKRWQLPPWLYTLIMLLISTNSLFYRLPSQPVFANFCLLIVGLTLLVIPKINLPTLSTKRHLWFIPFGYLAIILVAPTTFNTIAHNYRDTYRPWRYQAVYRANSFLHPRESDGHKPTLITAINPNFFSLYGDDQYQIINLSSTNPTNYEQLLSAEPEVFITNADNYRSPSFQQAFENLKQHFGIQLREIDCGHQCNYYRLFPENTPLSNQPHSSNTQQLGILNNRAMRIMMVSQRYENGLREVPITTALATPQLASLSKSESPDLFFLLGDAQDQQTKPSEALFRSLFADQVSFPITYVPGNADISWPKTLDYEPRLFQVNSTAFIIYQPLNNGEITPSTKLFLYNALLQLEKHPEIKSVFLITHRSNWLAGHSTYESLRSGFITSSLNDNDLFFRNELLEQLKKFSDKKWYVVSGDLQPLSHPTVVYQPEEEGRVTYIATSLNHTGADTYLVFDITENGDVSLRAKLVSGEEIPLSEYHLNYWIKEVEANQSRK